MVPRWNGLPSQEEGDSRSLDFQAPEVTAHGNPRVVVALPVGMPHDYFEVTNLFIGCFTNPTIQG